MTSEPSDDERASRLFDRWRDSARDRIALERFRDSVHSRDFVNNRRRHQRRGLKPLIAAAAVVALVAAGGAITGLRLHARSSAPATSSSLLPRPTTNPATTPSAGGHGPFVPAWMSFSDANVGWVVGTGCDACLLPVALSTDGGAHWTAVPSPAPHTTERKIAAATARDAWLFDPGLVETHDGGAKWSVVALPSGSMVSSVVIADQRVWAFATCGAGCAVTLLSAPEVGGSWHAVGQPPTDGTLVASVSAMYTFGTSEGARSTDHGATWTTFAVPCLGGSQNAVAAAVGTTNLMLVCWAVVGGGNAPKEAWTSADGGGHWTLDSRSAQPPDSSQPAVGRIPGSGTPTSISLPTVGVAWLSMAREDLFQTSDNAVSWAPSTVPTHFFGGGGGAEQVSFADPQHGWAFSPRGMYRTVDGGNQWLPVEILGTSPNTSTPAA